MVTIVSERDQSIYCSCLGRTFQPLSLKHFPTLKCLFLEFKTYSPHIKEVRTFLIAHKLFGSDPTTLEKFERPPETLWQVVQSKWLPLFLALRSLSCVIQSMES